MRRIIYNASANFDISTSVEVDDDADNFEIWLLVINDLQSRYGLNVEIVGESDISS